MGGRRRSTSYGCSRAARSGGTGRRLPDRRLQPDPAGRSRARPVWLLMNGIDVFIRPADVVAVWESAPPDASPPPEQRGPSGEQGEDRLGVGQVVDDMVGAGGVEGGPGGEAGGHQEAVDAAGLRAGGVERGVADHPDAGRSTGP